jgi:hypothetical protein
MLTTELWPANSAPVVLDTEASVTMQSPYFFPPNLGRSAGEQAEIANDRSWPEATVIKRPLCRRFWGLRGHGLLMSTHRLAAGAKRHRSKAAEAQRPGRCWGDVDDAASHEWAAIGDRWLREPCCRMAKSGGLPLEHRRPV